MDQSTPISQLRGRGGSCEDTGRGGPPNPTMSDEFENQQYQQQQQQQQQQQMLPQQQQRMLPQQISSEPPPNQFVPRTGRNVQMQHPRQHIQQVSQSSKLLDSIPILSKHKHIILFFIIFIIFNSKIIYRTLYQYIPSSMSEGHPNIIGLLFNASVASFLFMIVTKMV